MKYIIIVISLLFSISSTASANAVCSDQVALALADAEVDGLLIKVKKIKDAKGNKIIRGFRHFLRTSECEYGYVVVVSSHRCQVLDMYTQNGCRIDGIPSYFYWLKE